MILNSVFEDVVVANTDEQFQGCTFKSGTDDTIGKKGKGVFGLTIGENANVTIKNCNFENKGYSAIFMNSTGKIVIDGNHFDCTGLYNPIEGGSGTSNASLTEVTVINNVFEGICGNNYINVYKPADEAVIDIKDNLIRGMSQQAECIRLSNLDSKSATFNVSGLDYTYNMDTAYDERWTKMILCQDYTGTQDFTKYTININNVTCNGQEVADKDSFPIGGLIVMYANNGAELAEPIINF